MARSGGQRERSIRLGGADEHLVKHPATGGQFLSKTIVVRAGHGVPFGLKVTMVPIDIGLAPRTLGTGRLPWYRR